MFAATMTLSPIFCFITNMWEIQIKVNAMCHYSRKGIAHGANGIGAWMGIMEMISFLCIPINLMIVSITGDGDWVTPGQSSLHVFLSGRDGDFWST
jgi:cbb3-type cytochrome oxidase subunit 1